MPRAMKLHEAREAGKESTWARAAGGFWLVEHRQSKVADYFIKGQLPAAEKLDRDGFRIVGFMERIKTENGRTGWKFREVKDNERGTAKSIRTELVMDDGKPPESSQPVISVRPLPPVQAAKPCSESWDEPGPPKMDAEKIARVRAILADTMPKMLTTTKATVKDPTAWSYHDDEDDEDALWEDYDGIVWRDSRATGKGARKGKGRKSRGPQPNGDCPAADDPDDLWIPVPDYDYDDEGLIPLLQGPAPF